jgi:hypothetical protein
MNLRITIALVVLVTVAILGAVLVAWPASTVTPTEDENQAAQFVSENVRVDSPHIGETVPSTIIVRGEARGSWFFEASFPLQVRDPDNNKVGQGFAMTTDDWMTTEFVPFEGKVIVENYSGPATLVFLKDNPSGLPELDDAVEFPIVVR